MHGVVLPTRNDRKRIIIDMFHKLALEVLRLAEEAHGASETTNSD